MTTERLEEFAVLASILNYSKAAEKLFVSQSVLSRHIKDLEKEMGCTLFSRDTHNVTLTDEGRYLQEWIKPLLLKTDRLFTTLMKETAEITTQINVLCGDQSLSTQVLAFIRQYISLYPDIMLHASHVRSRQKREMIYACDVFISPCDFTNMLKNDTSYTLLNTQQALLAVSTSNPLSEREDLQLEDLRGETLIVPYNDDLLGPYSRNATAAVRKCQGLLRKMNTDNDQEGLLNVELGYGVMLIPYNMKDRIYPHTVTVPVSDKDCIFPIYAYLNTSKKNKAAAAFYEELCAAFHVQRS